MQGVGSIYVGDGPKLIGGGIEAMTYAGLTPVVVTALGIFALVTLVVFGCFAMDAITHLAVPQVAMINDMPEMVQNG